MLKRVLDSSPQYQGLMCFTIPEAVYLSSSGFNDLLVAYPTCQKPLIKLACEEIGKDKKVILMIDSLEHIHIHQEIAEQADVCLPVCLDIDMSSSFPGLHFGVRRSGIKSRNTACKLFKKIKSCSNLKLEGIMGYEAQIAGLGDNYPGQSFKNFMVKALKSSSIKAVAKRRKEVVEGLNGMGAQLELVNGGGTGSLESTRKEEVVTELTVGSGFYASALFDNYSGFKHLPSAGYAIEVVRKPKPGIYTCHGGGYIASGSVASDKQPVPYLPSGARLTKNEGAGEVQTPIEYKGKTSLELGDPIFMRHSKAGELCERFNTLLLIAEGKIAGEVRTYRGEGQCFL